MKYILLVGDGMADRPIEELNGKTVLEAANTQYMDEIVSKGRIGTVKTIPSGMTPASDVANLSIIGYDPREYYSGRGPFEAANMGIELKKNQIAFRLNTVTIGDDEMVDYSAGHISSKESSILIELLNKKIGNSSIRFYPGVSYRNLMIIECSSKEEAEGLTKVKCMPPHDIMGKQISKNLPKGKGSDLLCDIMNKAKNVLKSADVNKVRIDLGENPANMIWLWGQGTRPEIPSFKELFGLNGAVISAVDLVNGMGVLLGLEPIKVPGATGYYDTNYKGKAEYALKALEEKDFVFVHVEAPDEAGHNGDLMAKINAIENFDRHVVGTILNALKDKRDFRIMVLPDHATPISIRSHTDEPVPFAFCGEGVSPDDAHVFTETSARASGLVLEKGAMLMRQLIDSK